MGRRSRDCLRASQLEWRWLQNEAKELQKLEIGSFDMVFANQVSEAAQGKSDAYFNSSPSEFWVEWIRREFFIRKYK